MRKVLMVVGASVLVLEVAACGPASYGSRYDTSTAPNAANSIPQSPSSLPPGAQVNAPFTPNTGTIYRSGY